MAETSADNSAASARALRVLVVEDNPPDAELAVSSLRQAGYHVSFDVVDTPESSEERLLQKEYDIVLSDYNLRTWTAMDALQILRRSGKEIPFVIVTGSLGDEAAVECLKQGATDYVLKDRLHRLAFVVERALREKAQREEAARLEEQIRTGKREWELTFDTVPDPVVVLDDRCVIRRANRPAAALVGLAPGQLVGRFCYEVLHGSAQPHAECPHAHLLQSGRQERGDMHDPRLGKTFAVTVTPLKDSTGKILGCVRVLRDVTERNRAEVELRRLNRALQTLSQCNEAIVRATNEGDLLREVCQVLVGIGGYRLVWVGSAENDEKKTIRPVAQAGFDDGYVASLNVTWGDSAEGSGPSGAAVRTGRARVVRNIATDPTFAPWRDEAMKRGYASVAALPLVVSSRVFGSLVVYACERDAFDPKEVKLLTRLADDLAYGLMTICSRLEHARANEDRVRLGMAVEQAAEAISITETDGTIVYVNPAFERVTGYSRAEAIGQKPSILKSGKHDREFYRAIWETLLRGDVWSGRLINRNKDGALYEVEATISPVRDAAGRVVNYVAVKRDVTRERQLEQQLRQSQKMEAVGRLAGGIAHDFNNLLTAILGYSDLLLNQTSDGPLRKYGEEIKKAGDRAALLTRQLLAFSRQQVLEPQVLDLNAVVTNMEKILRRVIGEDIELTTILGHGLGRVKMDPGQVGQVILNLAVNSRDAMPQGGKLTIETANIDLDEAYARRDGSIVPGPYVMLAVSDTGCGMSLETQTHIFEPFFTTKELGKGTGLGLATVYGIAKQSGGSIWFYSELGCGTTFKIYLPRVADPVGQSAACELAVPASGGSETILLVEDEEALRRLVRGVLESRGYRVLEARHGEDALIVADGHKDTIHLLLADVVMPIMSGPELAEHLKPFRREMKVLFMSGYTDDAIVHHGVLDSHAAYLQKPFAPEDLARKVRSVLDAVGVGNP